jgi:hypothetical protein
MLTQQLGFHPELMDAHAIFIEGFRTTAEIIEAQEEFFEKLWFLRSVNNRPDRWQDDDDRDLTDDIRTGMMESRKRWWRRSGSKISARTPSGNLDTCTAIFPHCAGSWATSGTSSTPDQRDRRTPRLTSRAPVGGQPRQVAGK